MVRLYKGCMAMVALARRMTGSFIPSYENESTASLAIVPERRNKHGYAPLSRQTAGSAVVSCQAKGAYRGRFHH
jgi:hypothetical protein